MNHRDRGVSQHKTEGLSPQPCGDDGEEEEEEEEEERKKLRMQFSWVWTKERKIRKLVIFFIKKYKMNTTQLASTICNEPHLASRAKGNIIATVHHDGHSRTGG